MREHFRVFVSSLATLAARIGTGDASHLLTLSQQYNAMHECDDDFVTTFSSQALHSVRADCSYVTHTTAMAYVHNKLDTVAATANIHIVHVQRACE